MQLKSGRVSEAGAKKGRAMRRRIERALLVLGLLLVGVYVVAWLHGSISSRMALWQFENARSAKAASVPGGVQHQDSLAEFKLWAPKRVQAYKESLATKADPPLGVLQIPRLQLVAPIFEGTDDLTLNRGVGRIEGTAEIGQVGNTGIAGHRDGFFRPLKDIQVGDAIDLQVDDKTAQYKVMQIEIVKPEDTRVLVSTTDPELTLVTCYPFYFVGSAPQRFIVHASLMGKQQAANKPMPSSTR